MRGWKCVGMHSKFTNNCNASVKKHVPKWKEDQEVDRSEQERKRDALAAET